MIPGAPRPLVVAHRGGRYEGVPGEQTVAHVERAVALGVDFIEVDLRRTADGCLVCVHDPVHADVVIADVTRANLARASVAAGVPAPPSLAEVVEACAGRVRLDLELKVAGVEAQVLREVRESGLDRAVFKSFDDAIVAELKRLEPACTAGLLIGVSKPPYGPVGRVAELFPGRRLRACKADFVSPNFQLLRLGFAARARLNGLAVLAWTVNDPAVMARLLGEVDGLITDDPAACLALRRSASR